MLDHRQVSQLVVIAAVTVLSCTCSPPQRTGARCRPVWPMHSTCRRWTYTWESLTSTSSSPFYHVSPVASLCRNWMCCVMHQVCSQGVQHTLVYVHSYTHLHVHRLNTCICAYIAHTSVSWKCMVFCLTGVCVIQCIQGAWCLSLSVVVCIGEVC